MRLALIFIFSFYLQFILAGDIYHYSVSYFPRPDTTPPPPPEEAAPIAGPSAACIGETSEYTVDVPVACYCQWSVNGVIQDETGSPLVMNWANDGLQVISLTILCEDGQSSVSDPVSVIVYETPAPQAISGDNPVCEYTYHTYSIDAGPYDSCEWTVNGILLPGYATFITYSFGSSGIYHFEAIAYNQCGTGEPVTLDVTAQGAAPAPPGPIQGASESCEGQAETYTTTVGTGETCKWWIDGVLQPESSATLHVTWAERGSHNIEVRAVSGCGTGNPALKTVSVFYQPSVFLGNDTTILVGQTLLLHAGNTLSDYLWSTGATTESISVSVSGTYWVNVSNYCGEDADTTDVSVIVGIEEAGNPDDCFRMTVNNRKIVFNDLPQGAVKIQVVNLTGMILYDGPPVNEVSADRPGIYLIRVTTRETNCYQKVFIR